MSYSSRRHIKGPTLTHGYIDSSAWCLFDKSRPQNQLIEVRHQRKSTEKVNLGLGGFLTAAGAELRAIEIMAKRRFRQQDSFGIT